MSDSLKDRLDKLASEQKAASASQAEQMASKKVILASVLVEKREHLDTTGLEPYWKEEFQKIYDSNETYKGTWNWYAFFFGVFWALSKKAWLSAAVALILGLFTAGMGFIVYWFIFGIRGNYIYYNVHVKKKQLFG
jgi:hypothetical protein